MYLHASMQHEKCHRSLNLIRTFASCLKHTYLPTDFCYLPHGDRNGHQIMIQFFYNSQAIRTQPKFKTLKKEIFGVSVILCMHFLAFNQMVPCIRTYGKLERFSFINLSSFRSICLTQSFKMKLTRRK